MNRIIETALGINLVEETLKIALGEKPNLEPKCINHTFAQYVIISETGVLEKVTGRNMAAKCPEVQWVYIKPRKGSILTPPLSMGNRYAYVIAIGETENEARNNAKYAASLIKFWLLPVPEKEQEEPSENTVLEALSITEEIMEGFRSYLLEQGKSSAAVKRDTANVNIYLNWIKDTFNEEGISLNKEFILKYKNFLMETKGLKPKTINSKLYSLKWLNRFLVEKGIQNSVIIDKQDMIRTQNKNKAIETETICGFKENKWLLKKAFRSMSRNAF